jgi:hypothetical protein
MRLPATAGFGSPQLMLALPGHMLPGGTLMEATTSSLVQATEDAIEELISSRTHQSRGFASVPNGVLYGD